MSKYCLLGLNPPVSFQLEQGFNTVGRNPTNNLRLKDATVSSFHCEIVLDGDQVLVRDLGSSNGTYVAGQLVEESRVEPGATLRIGSVELKLQLASDQEPARISIPKLPTEPVPVPTLLADGYTACLNHPLAYATFRCGSCHKPLCPECVRILRLKRGETRVFCPGCSGACDVLPVPEGVATFPARKGSILGRLTQTIRIRSK